MEALAAAAAVTRNNIHAWLHRAPQEHTILPLSSSFFRIRRGLWFCPLPWIFFHEMLHYSDMMDDASVALATSRDFTSLWKHWIWSFIVLPECASFRIKKSCLKILDFKLYFNNFRSFSVLILKNKNNNYWSTDHYKIMQLS